MGNRAAAARPSRRARRVAAAATALALGVPLPAAAATPLPSPTSSSAAPQLPIEVQLSDLTPIAPQQHDVLRLTGTLRNVSTTPVTDLSVQLRYNPAHIGSRSEFDAYADTGCNGNTQNNPLPLPGAVAAETQEPSRTLAPGRSEPFVLQVAVDSLSLDRPWEVYQLGVQVNGNAGAGLSPVGGLRTVFPWAPVDTAQGHGQQTQVAWVWPLVDAPHRVVGATFADDALARSFAPAGRLGLLLGAGVAAQNQQPAPAPPAKKRKKAAKPVPAVVPVAPVPVTWAVDPMLVEDAELMAGGYKVQAAHGVVAGRGAATAKAWLAGLRSATARSDVLALPYADPDVVAANRAGERLAGEVQVATNSGQTLLSRALSTAPLTYAWPPGGVLDQNTLDTLFAAGISTVVLDDRAVPTATEPSVTPTAHTTIRGRDGNLDALLADHVLNCVIGTGLADPAEQRLAVQRFLGETLMIQAELPSDQRTVVVTPDRRWAPDASYAAALLGDTGKVPWIRPVSLSDALAAPEDTNVTRLGLHYPPQARRAELSEDYLQQVLTLKDSADSFAAILQPGDTNARAFDDALLRTLSSAWRGHPDGAATFRDRVTDLLSATKRRVRIASAANSFVTLTSHSGTVPVTVANELDTAVHVTVKISSQHLQVSGGGGVAETIPPHRQIAVDVRATARTSGVFPLDVKLLTPNGQVYDSTRLLVRSTAYGVVAILITAGATGVLLLAVVIRLVRRALAARRSATEAA